MGREEILEEARKLPAEERILLAYDLWNSAELEEIGLSPEQDAELIRRIEEHKRNPENVIAWADIANEMSSGKK
jgi:putative addiction module component (TIGR02574 family)